MAVHRDINMGDNVHWSIATHNISGERVDADAAPHFYVFQEGSDTAVYNSVYTKRSAGMGGLYRAFFPLLESSGFGVGKYFDVVTSGEVDSVVGLDVWGFKSVSGNPDVNLVTATGTTIAYPFATTAPTASVIADAVWDEDMSGHTAGNTFGSGVGDAVLPIFYADVKYTFDKNEPRDEYTATWYRNAVRVVSGDLESNIYIKALKRSDGSDLFATQTMDITNVNPAVFVHSETGVAQRLTAGEAAVVELSGTFAGENKVWYKIITRDSGVL